MIRRLAAALCWLLLAVQPSYAAPSANILRLYAQTPKYLSASKALFNSLSVCVLTTPQKIAINTRIAAAMADGVWQITDVWYGGLYGPCSELALKNWRKPGTNDLVVNGAVTFTAFSGYKSDGTTGFLDTQIVGSGFTFCQQNSCGARVYAATGSTGTAGLAIGQATSARLTINTHNGSAAFVAAVNTSTATSIASAVLSGEFLANRSGASAGQMYIDAVSVGTFVTASAARNANEVWLLKSVSSFAASTFILGGAWIGGSQVAGQVTNENVASVAYRAAIRQ